MKKIGSNVLKQGSSELSRKDIETMRKLQRTQILKTIHEKYKDQFKELGLDLDLRGKALRASSYRRGAPGIRGVSFDICFSYEDNRWIWTFEETSHRMRTPLSVKVRTTKSNDINDIIKKSNAMFKLVKTEVESQNRAEERAIKKSNQMRRKFPSIKIEESTPNRLKGTIGNSKVDVTEGYDGYSLNIGLSKLTEDQVKDFLQLIQLVT